MAASAVDGGRRSPEEVADAILQGVADSQARKLRSGARELVQEVVERFDREVVRRPEMVAAVCEVLELDAHRDELARMVSVGPGVREALAEGDAEARRERVRGVLEAELERQDVVARSRLGRALESFLRRLPHVDGHGNVTEPT